MMVADMIGEVPVMTIQNGVKVVNICRLIDVLIPDRNWQTPYEEVTNKIKAWLKENDASYYADVKEDFFIWKGVDKAIKEDKDIVVVEDLS